MFECNKCEYEDTEKCSSCIEVCCKPSNWKRKSYDIKDAMKASEIDVRKCNR